MSTQWSVMNEPRGGMLDTLSEEPVIRPLQYEKFARVSENLYTQEIS
jgi:hypothetical protein